ncbi:MAG: DUF3307 domain-containing protein [Bacilli bacterium]
MTDLVAMTDSLVLLILLLLLSHLTGDFIFQSNSIAKDKTDLNRSMRIHLLHHLFLNCVFVLPYWSMIHGLHVRTIASALSMSVVLVVFHWIIDMMKVRLTKSRWFNRDAMNEWRTSLSLGTFIVDQLLHMAAIGVVVYWYRSSQWTKSAPVFHAFLFASHLHLPLPDRIAVWCIALILVTRVSSIIVQILVHPLTGMNQQLIEHRITRTTHIDNFQSEIKDQKSYAVVSASDVSRGRQIGYLERIIIMILIYKGAYSAIGFVVAAKSLVRFKNLDHREWAEYFLVGTLISILLGMLWGFLLQFAS